MPYINDSFSLSRNTSPERVNTRKKRNRTYSSPDILLTSTIVENQSITTFNAITVSPSKSDPSISSRIDKDLPKLLNNLAVASQLTQNLKSPQDDTSQGRDDSSLVVSPSEEAVAFQIQLSSEMLNERGKVKSVTQFQSSSETQSVNFSPTNNKPNAISALDMDEVIKDSHDFALSKYDELEYQKFAPYLHSKDPLIAEDKDYIDLCDQIKKFQKVTHFQSTITLP